MSNYILEKVYIPDWVNWLAQDANGLWYGFIDKPEHDKYNHWWVGSGDSVRLWRGKPNPDGWRDELYKWE